MEIILTESIEGLGEVGTIAKVKPGYARNYLLPRGLAVVADKRNMKEFEHQKRQLERKAQKIAQTSEAIKARIEACPCVFSLRAGEEGKLFGSVTSADICDKLAAADIQIDRKKIQLDEPIKLLGEHQVGIKLPGAITATIKVVVNPADAD
ncbi:MAG: 50S ribosomal protein L9 [Desulfuromonas thiophila]|jgi:large subunit ribosomal protein L9|nr:50S ribosomal protein L9 [Desulfuromonas thiophila]